MTNNPANFREYAGVLTAFIVVMAFVAIGFVTMAITLFSGKSVPVPGDWMAAMLSLASAAIGFLIGKQSTQPQPPPPAEGGQPPPA
jgi:hypothetical protein